MRLTERTLKYAMHQVKSILMEKYPGVAEETAERYAKDIVNVIDWDNWALMHKGLRWITNEATKNLRVEDST